MKKCIAVDLDGTLAFYDGWRGEEHIGEPIPDMVTRIKHWLREGDEVVIFSARCDCVDNFKEITRIHKYLKKIGLPPLQVTNRKLKKFTEIWDDRAIRVEKNTGRISSQRKIRRGDIL